MTVLALLGLVALLFLLRQPLVVVLLAVAAFVQLAWGKGQLDYILEDMWVALDKELILSIPLFILCGNVMTLGSTAKR
jgi:C4-dicarboxylate transporter DctM subunit